MGLIFRNSFGYVLVGLGFYLRPFRDPSGDLFGVLGLSFWVSCGVTFWIYVFTMYVKALSVVPVLWDAVRAEVITRSDFHTCSGIPHPYW